MDLKQTDIKNNLNEDLKFVQDFAKLIPVKEIAAKLEISYSLLSKIIRGERSDHYNAINACKKAIEDKLQALMPQN